MGFEPIKTDSPTFQFLQMPKFIWEMDGLSLNAKVVYMLIYNRVRQGFGNERFIKKDGSVFCYYNDEELASQLKLTTRTVRRSIVELKEKGLVERERTNTKDGKSITVAFVPLGTDIDVLTNASSGQECPNLTDIDVLTYRTQMSAPFPYISNNNMSNNNRVRKEEKINKKEVEKEKSSVRVSDSSNPKKTKKDQVAEDTTQVVIDHWNAAYGTKYSTKTKGTIKLIASLLDSGYSQEDILKVIDYRAKNRKTKADYKWFVPATVLALKNFDRSYQFMQNDEARYHQINDGFDWHRV